LPPSGPKETDDILRLHGIDDIVSVQPPLPGNPDTYEEILQTVQVVSIGVDADPCPAFFSISQPAPIEIQAMGIGIELQHDAESGGRINHLFYIYLVWLSSQQ
jgi:hypothetical protein